MNEESCFLLRPCLEAAFQLPAQPQFSPSVKWAPFSIEIQIGTTELVSACRQVTASQLSSPETTSSMLFLADSEAEMRKWVQVLTELHHILKENRHRSRGVYVLKEAYDNGLPFVPHALSAAIIGV